MYPKICHHMPPYASICLHMPPYATICLHMPPYATICLYMPIALKVWYKILVKLHIVCLHMPLYATICHYMPPYATICHYMPPYATICLHMPLYASKGMCLCGFAGVHQRSYLSLYVWHIFLCVARAWLAFVVTNCTQLGLLARAKHFLFSTYFFVNYSRLRSVGTNHNKFCYSKGIVSWNSWLWSFRPHTISPVQLLVDKMIRAKKSFEIKFQVSKNTCLLYTAACSYRCARTWGSKIKLYDRCKLYPIFPVDYRRLWNMMTKCRVDKPNDSNHVICRTLVLPVAAATKKCRQQHIIC